MNAVKPALDVSDVAPRVGKPVGGAELWEPCSALSIRKWAMAMDYPNPLHWDEDFARASKFGGLVAPQSFTVAMDCGQGMQAALVGHIAKSQVLFGGDEWWFYGPRPRPGDQHFTERRFSDYRVTETRFAGPTMFARGETIHRNQHDAVVARQRTTAIRYLAAEAQARGAGADQPKAPVWSADALAGVAAIRHAWILSGREGRSPAFDKVSVGDVLPRRAIGPHSLVSLATEFSALPFITWGAARWVTPPGMPQAWTNDDAGCFDIDYEGAKIDPRLSEGLEHGPWRAHLVDRDGRPLPRAFGLGVSMNAWANDYLAYWAGHDGFVRHTKVNFVGLALQGDVAFLDAEIIDKQAESAWGVPLVSLRVKMTNQDGALLLDGTAEVELPPTDQTS